jgi:hypothetical protein
MRWKKCKEITAEAPFFRVLEVSDYFVAGEIALQKSQWDLAAELLEKAAAVEDTLSFREPPQWLQPVRRTLGAVYLETTSDSFLAEWVR